jgi:hypothetical protein
VSSTLPEQGSHLCTHARMTTPQLTNLHSGANNSYTPPSQSSALWACACASACVHVHVRCVLDPPASGARARPTQYVVLQPVDQPAVQQLLQLPVIVASPVDCAQHTQRVLDGFEGDLIKQDLPTVGHLRHVVCSRRRVTIKRKEGTWLQAGSSVPCSVGSCWCWLHVGAGRQEHVDRTDSWFAQHAQHRPHES